MSDDKELDRLEAEFPRAQQALQRDTSAEFDEKILRYAARRAARNADVRMRRERLPVKPVSTPPRPTTERPDAGPRLDADIASAESFDMFNERAPEESFSALQYRSLEVPPTGAPPGAAKLLKLLGDATQKEWLDHISQLVLLGDTHAALYLLEEYHRRFDES